MIIICIDKYQVGPGWIIEVGEQFEAKILFDKDDYYWIKYKSGHISLSQSCFITLDEWRQQQLNKLL